MSGESGGAQRRVGEWRRRQRGPRSEDGCDACTAATRDQDDPCTLGQAHNVGVASVSMTAMSNTCAGCICLLACEPNALNTTATARHGRAQLTVYRNDILSATPSSTTPRTAAKVVSKYDFLQAFAVLLLRKGMRKCLRTRGGRGAVQGGSAMHARAQAHAQDGRMEGVRPLCADAVPIAHCNPLGVRIMMVKPCCPPKLTGPPASCRTCRPGGPPVWCPRSRRR